MTNNVLRQLLLRHEAKRNANKRQRALSTADKAAATLALDMETGVTLP